MKVSVWTQKKKQIKIVKLLICSLALYIHILLGGVGSGFYFDQK